MTRRARIGLAIVATVLTVALLRRDDIAAVALGDRRSPSAVEEQLARFRGAVRAIPEMENAAAQLRELVVAMAPALLDGTTESRASAGLSLLLVAAADRNQVTLARSAPMADSSRAGRLRRVAATATFSGSGVGLAGTIASLSTSHPLLEIRRLSIVARDASGPAESQELLILEVDVAGWYLTGATP